MGEFDRCFPSLCPQFLTIWLECNSYWMDFFLLKKKKIYLDLKCFSKVCIHVCKKKKKKSKMTMYLDWPYCKFCQISSVQFSSCIIVLCFRSWSGSSENASLTLFFLITVLSYRPVEFSRKTLPSLSHSLSRDLHAEERRSLYSLRGTSFWFSVTQLQWIKKTHSTITSGMFWWELCHLEFSQNVVVNIAIEPLYSLYKSQ